MALPTTQHQKIKSRKQEQDHLQMLTQVLNRLPKRDRSKIPNWGRVVMTLGKCFDDRNIDPNRITIRFGDAKVFELGSPVDCDLDTLRRYLDQHEVVVNINLGVGKAFARVWGCDLTEEYVKENAYYTT